MSNALTHLISLLTVNYESENHFKGESFDLGLRQVFGGQIFAQALNAAMQVVVPQQLAHSCHAIFLNPADAKYPIIYQTTILRTGFHFTFVRVNAIQQEQKIAEITLSFHQPETGFEHQTTMPTTPSPESFMSEEAWITQLAQHLPTAIARTLMTKKPFEIRTRYLNNPFKGENFPPIQQTWVKAKSPLPKDQRLQQCLLAYFSDFHCLLTALHPHQKGFLQRGMKVATIDHHIWFHRPFDLSDWLLHHIESSNAYGALGLAKGEIFDQNGRLIATTQQEGLIRYKEE